MKIFQRYRRLLGLTCVLAVLIILVCALHERGRNRNQLGDNDKRDNISGNQSKGLEGYSNSHSRDAVRSKRNDTLLSPASLFIDRYKQVLDSNATMQSKRIELRRLTKEYVEAVGIQEALNHIESIAGAGTIQNQLYRDLFEFAPDSQSSLLAIAKNIEFDDTREFAIGGIFNKMRDYGIEDKALNGLFPLPDNCYPTFDVLVQGLIGPGAGGRPAMEIKDGIGLLMRAYPDAKVYDQHLHEFLAHASDGNSLEVWEQCKNLFQNNPELLASVGMRCLNTMVARNPKMGMQEVMKFYDSSTGNIPGKYFDTFLTNYISFDSSAALEWYKSNSQLLDENALDAVKNAFVKYNLDQGGIAGANQWVEQIKDPESRESASRLAWSKERDVVRAQINQDPSSAMQLIVSGQSQHEDSWIEEAMTTWIAKEPDKAREWYETHRELLPQSKTQFIAAAYANQAIAKGDVAIAEHWMALIADQELRLKLEAGIKAAGKK